MEIVIENVTTAAEFADLSKVRRNVFEKEWRARVHELPLQSNGKVWHLVARIVESQQVVGTLSVVDTSGDHQLHRSHALYFPEESRVARMAQLAVLKEFRGLQIPSALIHEAGRRILQPHYFDFSWLLFDARRAQTCRLVRDFGYTVSQYVLQTDYGWCRILTRYETQSRPAYDLAACDVHELVGGELRNSRPEIRAV